MRNNNNNTESNLQMENFSFLFFVCVCILGSLFFHSTTRVKLSEWAFFRSFDSSLN